MSLIVGYYEKSGIPVLLGDGRSTTNTEIDGDYEDKVVVFKNFMIGCCGDSRLPRDLRLNKKNFDKIIEGKDFLPKVYKGVKDIVLGYRETPKNSQGYYHVDNWFVIITKENLYYLDAFGDFSDSDDFYVSGSGRTQAEGIMTYSYPDIDPVKLFKASIKYNATVGGRCVKKWFNKDGEPEEEIFIS